jgi:hypothetical protein
MTRQCARPDCADQAKSTFGYHYTDRTVWLGDLADDPHPSTYDLCGRHAANFSVPVGWNLRDGRNLAPTLVREAS